MGALLMIKKIVLIAGVFVVGVITGAATLYLLFGRDAQRGAAMLYANAFEAQVDTAFKNQGGGNKNSSCVTLRAVSQKGCRMCDGGYRTLVDAMNPVY